MIIGISGKKQSGKSLVATLLAKRLGNCIVVNFADAVKEEVARACNTTLAEVEKNKPFYRKLLQCWGTDYRRQQNDDYWIEKWGKKVSYIMDNRPLTNIIAADVRFLNEIGCIEASGGLVIRVVRPSLPPDFHVSETELDNYPFDLVIENNGTIEQLEEQIKKLEL